MSNDDETRCLQRIMSVFSVVCSVRGSVGGGYVKEVVSVSRSECKETR